MVSDMFSYVSMASAHLVKYSTATMMYLWFPDDAGLQVIKSIPYLQKVLGGKEREVLLPVGEALASLTYFDYLNAIME